MKPILKNLSELTKAKVISEETAENIRNYYSIKADKGQSRQQLALGIFGALLVGLGIILIIAHNWDEFSRTEKTILSFLPLVLGQSAGGYVLWKKSESIILKEVAATFIFFALGACISMVSQVYNIIGDLDNFLITWMLLVLPLVYLFNAAAISLLFQAGITWYACLIGYGYNTSSGFSWYWVGLLLIIPFYYYLIKNKRESIFTVFHHWSLPLSLAIVFGTIGENYEFLMYLAYFCLFNLYYQTGNLNLFKDQSNFKNGYKSLGVAGMLIILFISSYKWFWSDLQSKEIVFREIAGSPEIIISGILILLLALLHFKYLKESLLKNFNFFSVLYLPFILIYVSGFFILYLPQVLINLLIIFIAFLILREGSRENNLRNVNAGLVILSLLIFCRFFDWNLSFVLRGIAFILVGTAFFLNNYIMIKNRKTAGF